MQRDNDKIGLIVLLAILSFVGESWSNALRMPILGAFFAAMGYTYFAACVIMGVILFRKR